MVKTVQEQQKEIQQLSEAFGPSGCEDEIRCYVAGAIGSLGEVSLDAHGSYIVCKEGEKAGPRIMLDAHMDEVGFMVSAIHSNGLMSFVPLGGWWSQSLPAQRVCIQTAQGKVMGVVTATPPHFMTEKQRQQAVSLDHLRIDIGAQSPEECSELGVKVGCFVAPYASFYALNKPHLFAGKALDNRLGVGLLLQTMRTFAKKKHPNTIVAVASVQEEVGCRGAVTATEIAKPDVAIILEAPPADDRQGDVVQGGLGRGPQVRLLDPTAIFCPRLNAWVQDVAKAHGVEIQVAVRQGGGTNAKAVHLNARGVPCVVIGVPARYIHTHQSIFDWHDYTAALRLIQALIGSLDAERLARLRPGYD